MLISARRLDCAMSFGAPVSPMPRTRMRDLSTPSATSVSATT
jgi:hypothetical protein